MGERRYYWLKLKDDFFSSKRIKKLRNMAGGDTYLIIYLKLQLKAMKSDGIISFDHLEENIADELALDLDENPDDIRATLIYLVSCGLAETSNDECIYFPYAVENVGSEGSSAARVREHRARINAREKETKALLGNADVTKCNTEIEKDIDIEKDIEIESKNTRSRAKRPTLDEVKAYVAERGNKISAEKFYDYYESNGWRVGKNPMKDWKAAVRTWESKEKQVSWYKSRDEMRSEASSFDTKDFFQAALDKSYGGG